MLVVGVVGDMGVRFVWSAEGGQRGHRGISNFQQI